MASITLSAAVRSNLLALSQTARLIDRTQDRLSTGLRVNSPVDDAKAFFESKALSDRAATINETRAARARAVCQLSARRHRLKYKTADIRAPAATSLTRGARTRPAT